MNPVRKFYELYNLDARHQLNEREYIAKTLDFFQRVVVSLMLFQAIKAFRKFVRN